MTITDESWCARKAKELLATIDGKRIVDSEEDTAAFLLQFRRETERNYKWQQDNKEKIRRGFIRI